MTALQLATTKQPGQQPAAQDAHGLKLARRIPAGLAIQRAAGNRAVGTLIQRCSSGHT